MNDKRDEVKKQIESALDGWSYDDWAIDPLADLILSRETELRRQIADELSVISDSRLTEYRLVQYIEKLRGNK
jgi:hypothetical protein